MVEKVVREHAGWGSTIVIDGWYLRPKWVSQLELDNVWSCWIVASAGVLEEREKKVAWYQDSTDPDRMLKNFLARSLWYNDLIMEQATEHQMTILFQTGQISVSELCERVLEETGS